jgi:dynein-related subfamily AAA family protein
VVPGSSEDATAIIRNYLPFKSPVPRLALGSELRRSSQHSISPIDEQAYDELVRLGMTERPPVDNWLYVLTASGPAARAHYAETIAKPIGRDRIRELISDSDLPADVNEFRAWGALPGPRNTVVWQQMQPGDWVVTYWNRKYHEAMQVLAKFDNEELAASLWGRDTTSGETWRLMYLLGAPHSVEIQADRVADWLPSSYQGFTRISEARVQRIVERFGGIRPFIESHLGTDFLAEAKPKPYLSFQEQVERVHQFLGSRGYVIAVEDLANFITCLRVKPFVILAGVSGIGKSRLVRLFGDAVGARCEVIPVQPNWTDNADLFGYVDPVRQVFVPGRCTVALREAESLGTRPFLLCLDEMNLAHVEYYFADFLSVLESRRLDDLDRVVTDDLLGNLRAQLAAERKDHKDAWPPLPFPNNAFVIGTVNMDETTHPFSRKVLDRANTIELTNMSLATVLAAKQAPVNTYFDWEYLLPGAVSLSDVYDGAREFFDELIAELTILNSILEPLNQHFAYRVRDEICLYCYYAQELPGHLPPSKAMDYQILQKILPRLHGSTEATRHALSMLFERITPGTNAVSIDRFDLPMALDEVPAARYPMSARKLALMLDRFQSDGFTSFWL